MAEGTNPSGIDIFPTRLLTISDLNNGRISGSGQYRLGSTAELLATPDDGFTFSGWTGDVEGSVNPLSIEMVNDISVGAVFAQDNGDSDQDGVSNFAEIRIHETDPDNPDSDGDGFSDGLEVAEQHVGTCKT